MIGSAPHARTCWRSRAFLLLNLLQGLREGAVVPSEQIDFALDLLNGKCSADHTPPPAPWSTEAFRQLEKYSWENWYSEDVKYRDKSRKTPVENAIQRIIKQEEQTHV